MSARGSIFEKILNSDEHFDRCFSFYRNGSQTTKSKEKKRRTMNSLSRFKKTRILSLLIAPTLVLAVLTAVPASATPGCGLGSETLSVGHFPDGLLDLMCKNHELRWDLKTKVKGDSDVYVVRNTWPVGAHSGWHTHPGPSLITVITGELTVYDADDATCTPTVYRAGESFTDVGCGDVHLIRNEGTVCAVNMVVQIVPAGEVRRIDADQPPNCPVFTCPSPTPCPQ